MDKKRNIELENWLIETTGEEMMANHLGPNWNRFHEECGFYTNISMTIADQVWEHKQKRIDGLQKQLIDQGQRFNENTQKITDAEYKNRQLQARLDGAIKWVEDNKKSIPLSEWHGYTTEEYVDADDLLDILKSEQALKGGEV